MTRQHLGVSNYEGRFRKSWPVSYDYQDEEIRAQRVSDCY